jgi:Uncharacterised ACR (DUF711)
MKPKKIIRSLCYFTTQFKPDITEKLDNLRRQMEDHDFELQTQRICFESERISRVDAAVNDGSIYLSVGRLNRKEARESLSDFLKAGNVAFNLDLSDCIEFTDIDLLFDIISQRPTKTFSFAYTFNVLPSSPYFPSARYEKDGFAIGLQPTDLSQGCATLSQWLENMKKVWEEVCEIFKNENDFLGIDTSIAPLFLGDSSFIHFIKSLIGSFPKAVTTDTFLRVSEFIKNQNPRPVGLCGIMLPCLEDFELAEEYEKGHFSIERNVFLSLHCGLGVDTYPIGIDEKPERIMEILQLLRGLSTRYNKPLSARFISDGQTKIGETSNFQNPFLKDVNIRKL